MWHDFGHPYLLSRTQPTPFCTLTVPQRFEHSPFHADQFLGRHYSFVTLVIDGNSFTKCLLRPLLYFHTQVRELPQLSPASSSPFGIGTSPDGSPNFPQMTCLCTFRRIATFRSQRHAQFVIINVTLSHYWIILCPSPKTRHGFWKQTLLISFCSGGWIRTTDLRVSFAPWTSNHLFFPNVQKRFLISLLCIEPDELTSAPPRYF